MTLPHGRTVTPWDYTKDHGGTDKKLLATGLLGQGLITT